MVSLKCLLRNLASITHLWHSVINIVCIVSSELVWLDELLDMTHFLHDLIVVAYIYSYLTCCLGADDLCKRKCCSKTKTRNGSIRRNESEKARVGRSSTKICRTPANALCQWGSWRLIDTASGLVPPLYLRLQYQQPRRPMN